MLLVEFVHRGENPQDGLEVVGSDAARLRLRGKVVHARFSMITE
jgi:hypothetical protein